MVAPKSIANSRSTNAFIHLWSRLVAGKIMNRKSTTTATKTVCVVLLALVGWIGMTPSSSDSYSYYTESKLTILSNSSTVSALLLQHDQSTIADSSSTGIAMELSSKTKANNIPPPTSDSSSIHSNTIQVVFEKDVAKDFSNQTSFEGTYFDSSPACTSPLLTPDQVSFTLVTQASMDRLWIMKHHCQRWPPPLPISIAIYLPSSSLDAAILQDETHVAQALDRLGCDLRRMNVTVLKGSPGSTMERYPVNLLRNLAIRSATTTSHVVYTDSDFLISDGLHEDLMAMAPTVANDSTAAIVIPAFVYHSACTEPFSSENVDETTSSCVANESKWGIPKTKEDLRALWVKPRAEKPNVKPGFHGVHFHGSTKYTEYVNQTDPLLIPCLTSYLYEPYLAVRLCNELPEFPEVFRGYGWNKNVWIMWLTRKHSYRLFQTPRGFVVHLPHEKSPSWQSAQKTDPKSGRKSTAKPPPEHDAYLSWFKKQVPNHPNRIPPCKAAKKGQKRR